MRSKQRRARSVSRSAGEHDRLLTVDVHARILEHLVELLARTDLEVLFGVGDQTEGNADASRHVSAGQTGTRLWNHTIVATLRTRVDHGHADLSRLVVVDQVQHLIQRADHRVVRVHVEASHLLHRSRLARLHGTLLGLPARETSTQHVHTRILVEHTERPPGARGAEQSVRVVPTDRGFHSDLHHNVVSVVETHLLNALLEEGRSRQHMGQTALRIRNRVQVKELRSRNVLLER